MDYLEWKQRLQNRVIEELDFAGSLQDKDVWDAIDRVLFADQGVRWYSYSLQKKVREEIFRSLRRLDVLQVFIEDPTITEIMVNGPENIFIEREGALVKTECKFESKRKLQDVIQQIVAGCNRVVNEASPIVDARLEDGSRVNIVAEPVALNGPIVTIRRFPEKPITMDELIERKSITAEAAAFLKDLVKAKYNILISGGTGSGKTTFLNVLSGFVGTKERVVTIEDSAELQLQGLDNLVTLETRNSNREGCEEISVRDLIKTSLRMRPDRIIVGEVRGMEAVDMLQALNTGHDGSMSTAHANSAGDLLFRLESMVLMGIDIPLSAVRRQIASGVDIIVHVSRMRDLSRRVEEIREIIGCDEEGIQTRVLYAFEEEVENEKGEVKGELRKKNELFHVQKIKKAGLWEKYADHGERAG